MISVGELYYNGFYFPGAITATVQQAPVPDSTGRYNKYQTFNIKVEFIVHPGCDEFSVARTHPVTGNPYVPVFPTSDGNIDGTIGGDTGYEQLRRILTQNGGVLKFVDKGVGTDFIVGPVRVANEIEHADVNFGPKVTVLSWEPLGSNCSARIVWECTATIADCTAYNNYFETFGAEFSYTVSWNITADGLQSKTVNGQLEVPAFRLGVTLDKSADLYRQRIQFETPFGFIRQVQNYNLSPDRKLLTFTIVDVESTSDNPFDKGVIDCRVVETLSSSGSIVAASGQWNMSFDGTITVAKGYQRWLAWSAFVRVVSDRREHIKQRATVNRLGNDKAKNHVFLKSLKISEDIYGRSMSFSLTFWVICDTDTILSASGLWKPVPLPLAGSGEDADDTPASTRAWKAWRDNLETKAWSVRGAAQLYHNQATDSMISLCTNQAVNVASDTPVVLQPGYDPTYGDTLPDSIESGSPLEDTSGNPAILTTPKVDPAMSWISYNPVVELIEDVPIVVHRPIVGADTYETDIEEDTLQENWVPNPDELTASYDTEDRDGLNRTSNSVEPIIQQRGATIWLVRFHGTAMRQGYAIPRPTLLQFNGKPVHRYRDMVFEQRIVNVADNNSRVYLARWHGLYVMEESPEYNSKDEWMRSTPDERTFLSGK